MRKGLPILRNCLPSRRLATALKIATGYFLNTCPWTSKTNERQINLIAGDFKSN